MWANTMPLWNTFWELRRELDRLFDNYDFGLLRGPNRRAVFPALNIWDNAESIFVEAEVPGVKAADLEISAVGNELTIKGRRAPLENKDLTYHRQERGVGEFTRVVTLPCDVDADKVDASLKDGVLRIELPKAAAARPRQITVKTA